MSGDAQVAAADLDEERIALCSPHGCDMANGPDQQTHEPEAQAEAHGSGQRAIQDVDVCDLAPVLSPFIEVARFV